MFAIPRRCAEPINQSCPMTVSVTLQGQSTNDNISCPLFNFKTVSNNISSWNIRHNQIIYREKNHIPTFSSHVIMPSLFISYSEVVSAPYLLHRLKDFYTPVKRRVVLYPDIVRPSVRLSVCLSICLSVCPLTFCIRSIFPKRIEGFCEILTKCSPYQGDAQNS